MTICEEFVNQFGTLFLWCFALSSSHSAQFFLVLDFILIVYYSVNSLAKVCFGDLQYRLTGFCDVLNATSFE